VKNEMTRDSQIYSKVPEVTLGFWIIKILATTLGETGGDSVTMTWLKADVMANSGYLIGSAIFLSALIVLVLIQIATRKFHPFLYWATIVASTTFGTTLADFATRSLGIGYTGGSLLLFGCLPPAVLNFMVAEQYAQEPGKVASIVLIGNVLSVLFVPVALSLALR